MRTMATNKQSSEHLEKIKECTTNEAKALENEFNVFLGNDDASTQVNPSMDYREGRLIYGFLSPKRKEIDMGDGKTKKVPAFVILTSDGEHYVRSPGQMLDGLGKLSTVYNELGFNEYSSSIFREWSWHTRAKVAEREAVFENLVNFAKKPSDYHEFFDIGLEQLYDFIRKKVEMHVWFAEPIYYDLLALWIVATYMHQAFPSLGYCHCHGVSGSGKSRALSVLSSLAWKGLSASSISPASLYRIVEAVRPTLIIDEDEQDARNR